MNENVIGNEAFKEAEKQAEQDKKDIDSAKKMQEMISSIADTTSVVLINTIKSKKGIDLSDIKEDIKNNIESGMMMGLLVPVMCH